ncbi:hypothetical protein BpHYR1_013920 [Brachionus plicatilis]|uniref:Uncharacterized protein n=1 Tax=Brachionus plicatilis TaxID=10195 RepID=A0A3M7R589_BRAPC|nr:hypothetical protein BpHYR1_013920 [Brachionus plicatilis]
MTQQLSTKGSSFTTDSTLFSDTYSPHFSNVSGGKIPQSVFGVRVVLGGLVGHVVVAESDTVSADVNLAPGVGAVGVAVAALGPVDQFDLTARHHASHLLGVCLIGQLGGRGRSSLCQSSATTQHQPALAAQHSTADPLEQNSVKQSGGPSLTKVLQLLPVGQLEQHLLEPAGLGQFFVDCFGQAFQNNWHRCHYGRLQDPEVSFSAFFYSSRIVGYGLRAGIGQWNSVGQAHYLAHELQNMGQRQIGNVFVFVVVYCAQTGYQTLGCCQNISVADHDTFWIAS